VELSRLSTKWKKYVVEHERSRVRHPLGGRRRGVLGGRTGKRGGVAAAGVDAKSEGIGLERQLVRGNSLCGCANPAAADALYLNHLDCALRLSQDDRIRRSVLILFGGGRELLPVYLVALLALAPVLPLDTFLQALRPDDLERRGRFDVEHLGV